MAVTAGQDETDWRPRAPHSTEFEQRAIRALDRAARVLGWSSWDGEHRFDDQASAVQALDFCLTILVDRLRVEGERLERDELLALCALHTDVEELRQELRQELMGERYDALVGVQAGLARLRGIGSVDAMIDKATAEVCRACGFDRSIFFRVLDSQMVPVGVHFTHDPDGARELLEIGRAQPANLDHLLLETEMVRRRMPMLVRDAQNDPRVNQAIAIASRSQSYVAAPIMPEGRVIGFLHADRYDQRRQVDEFDRDLLWAFAEGFGYAFERTVLVERLRAQREQVRGMVASTEQLLDEVCDTEIEVGRVADADPAATRTAAMLAGRPSRLDQLLTRREVEVIRLMASGETNAGIASRLVISEGTVKSHVKHILRKLRAANRAEAVSRYLRVNALDQPG